MSSRDWPSNTWPSWASRSVWAILTGVPIGIAITQNQRVADRVLYGASMIMTIPSVALFGLMIPILSLIGQGIGYLPAVIAVLLYSQLPIIRNTYTAITNVDPALREAARGMGMTTRQRFGARRDPAGRSHHHGGGPGRPCSSTSV